MAIRNQRLNLILVSLSLNFPKWFNVISNFYFQLVLDQSLSFSQLFKNFQGSCGLNYSMSYFKSKWLSVFKAKSDFFDFDYANRRKYRKQQQTQEMQFWVGCAFFCYFHRVQGFSVLIVSMGKCCFASILTAADFAWNWNEKVVLFVGFVCFWFLNQ